MVIYMIIVGMDPSIQNWGMVKVKIGKDKIIQLQEVAVIHSLASKKGSREAKATYKNKEDLERGVILVKKILSFSDKADHIFVELPVASQSARACVSYGMCVGLFAAVAEIGIPYTIIRNNEIKRMAGYKDDAIRPVEKNEVIEYVSSQKYDSIFSGFKKAEHEHIADAMMTILVGVEKYGNEIITNFYGNNK